MLTVRNLAIVSIFFLRNKSINSKYFPIRIQKYIIPSTTCCMAFVAVHLEARDRVDEEVRAINFNPLRRPKRQDWMGELVENGAFYFTSVQLLRQGQIQGGK